MHLEPAALLRRAEPRDAVVHDLPVRAHGAAARHVVALAQRVRDAEGIPGVGGLTAGEIGFIGVIGLDNAGDAVGTEP